MSYTVFDSYFKVDKRGNHTLVKPGTIISNAVYNKLTPAKQAKCVINDTTRYPYSIAEYTAIKDTYVDLGHTNNLEDMWADYQRRMPNSDASKAGVICQLCIIRGMDIYTHYKGFNNPSKALQNILWEEDPIRFDSANSDIEDKLDALLTAIR